MWHRLIPLLCLVAVIHAAAADPLVADRVYDPRVTNRCPQPSEDVPIPNAHYYTHPRDCRKFVSCAYGLPHVMDCPPGLLFNEELVACVMEDGPFNRGIACNAKGSSDPAEGTVCEGKAEGRIPHAEHCHRYYDCADNSSRPARSLLGPMEAECTYPDLFDAASLTCRPWTEATCAEGAVPGKAPCDYLRQHCVAAHCEPCWSRAPSCVGKEDGLHAHPTKTWTPYHVRCQGERTMEVLACPKQEHHKPFSTVWHLEKGGCVPLWEVPRDKGGFAPKCMANMTEGLHGTPESDTVYFECPGATVHYCEAEQIFNQRSQKCVDSRPTPVPPPTPDGPSAPVFSPEGVKSPEVVVPATSSPEVLKTMTSSPEVVKPVTSAPEVVKPVTSVEKLLTSSPNEKSMTSVVEEKVMTSSPMEKEMTSSAGDKAQTTPLMEMLTGA